MRGLIAILFAMFSGKPAHEILAADAIALFERLGLREHLTPAALERIPFDGRAHSRGRRARHWPPPRKRRARRCYLRRRRCWPSPICLARCERAAA